MKKLGVNIDHIATLRNARGEDHPNILFAAAIAIPIPDPQISMPKRLLFLDIFFESFKAKSG